MKEVWIAAAAANRGVVFWSATGWIDAAIDTVDGTHPNLAGQTKIAAQIMAVLNAQVVN